MRKIKGIEIDAMVQGYLATELWAGTVMSIEDPDIDQSDIDWENESPHLDNLGYDIECFSAKALQTAKDECDAFYMANEHLLDGCDLETVGHDFMLTRNGHGAGFWDGDYEHGDELTNASKPYGETYIYVDAKGEVCFE
jgi:hypothetical protein